ncbi:hypothetical protein PPS11_38479 [Pseudomonas putida S11]|nr:hypothetical protein PPS11_38479 [Pseudomonas putida S11]
MLFTLFACGLARRWRGSKLALLSAALVLLHGLGSLGTGWFPCDQGCAPAQPSPSQQLHNLSGLLMFLSLTLASALWAWLGNRIAGSRALGLVFPGLRGAGDRDRRTHGQGSAKRPMVRPVPAPELRRIGDLGRQPGLDQPAHTPRQPVADGNNLTAICWPPVTACEGKLRFPSDT